MLPDAPAVHDGAEIGRGRLRRSAPLVAGLTVVVALGALALLVGRAGLHEAERARLSDRSRLIERVASNTSGLYDPERIRDMVARLSLVPGELDRNALLLRQLQLTPTGDQNLLVGLVDPDGVSLLTIPAGRRVPVTDLGASWPAALAGRPVISPVFALEGRPVRATVVPVGGDRPWAVLVQIADEAGRQQLVEGLTALGSVPGGFAEVDADGVAVVSWDPELRGRRLVEPGRLAGLVPGTVRVWTEGSGAGQITCIAAVQGATGYTTIFRQPSARLFGDLRAGRRQRDFILLGVLTICVGGLVVFNLRREQAVRRARTRLHTLLAGVRDIIVVVGEDRTMTLASPAVQDLLGYHGPSWLGRVLTDFAHPDDRDRIRRLLTEPGGGTVLDVRLVHASGEVRWFDLEASDFTDHPALAGVLVTCHEVGERKNLQDQLGHQASHDPLTGLPNRVLFTSELESMIGVARSGGPPFAVLFIDLDHFKPVNDGFGHAAGDAVLQIIAERLTRAVREGDLAARLGGDEFGILLRDADEAFAGDAADRIIESVRAPITLGTSVVHVDASVGVAASMLLLDTPEHFLRAADRAMYEAKSEGRGRAVVATAPSSSPPRSGAVSATAPRALPGARSPQASLDEADGGNPVLVPRRPPVAPAGRLSSRCTASPARRPTGRVYLERLGRLAPPLVAGAVLLAVAAASLWLVTQTRHTAEEQRMADRLELTTAMADFHTHHVDPGRLIGPVSEAPWSLTDRTSDEQILRLFAGSRAGGKNYVWALATLDGEVLASDPPSVTLPLGPGDVVWRAARGGRAGSTPVMKVGGVFRDYLAIPVMRAGAPVAILVVGESLRDSPVETGLQVAGTIGFHVGGFSAVDRFGTVVYSWDVGRIGQRTVSPGDLEDVPVGRARQIHPAGAGGQITLAASLGPQGGGGYLLFQQPASVFYGDLRSGQAVRDWSLLAVVAAAVVGLTVMHRRREAALRCDEEHLRALLHNAHDIVIAADADSRISFVSSGVETLLGRRAGSCVGRRLLDGVHPDDRETLAEFLRSAASVGTAVVRDLRLRAVDHSHRWFDIEAIDLRARPEVAAILLTCHEIGERKALQDKLHHQARHDALTGLPNRAAFIHRLDAVAAGRDTTTFTVLFIDLDQFKPLNDTYGHDTGDEVLRVIGARLAVAGTQVDGTQAEAVCRIGGDEFAVVLRDADGAQARSVADRLLEVIRQPISVDGRSVTVDAAIGIAMARPDDGHPEVVVRNADLAMYRVKEAGRGGHAVFVP